jgi:hypothetical protein
MLGQVVNNWRCLKKPEIEDWLRLGAATNLDDRKTCRFQRQLVHSFKHHEDDSENALRV